MDPIFYNIAFISGGGGLGYLYYRLVGCRTGSCPLTSSPLMSILTGVFLASMYVFNK